MAAGLCFSGEKLLAGFGAERGIDEDCHTQKEDGSKKIEISHYLNNVAHSFMFFIINKLPNQKIIEDSIPISKPSDDTLLPINIGTTVDPKNSKPIFENVSATIFNWELDSIYDQ